MYMYTYHVTYRTSMNYTDPFETIVHSNHVAQLWLKELKLEPLQSERPPPGKQHIPYQPALLEDVHFPRCRLSTYWPYTFDG